MFGLAELTGLGLTSRSVQLRAHDARLHRVHQAVYSLVPPPLLTVKGRYRAATLAATGRRHTAALSHRSGADLEGLRECHRRVVEVIVPGRHAHRHPGIQVHRSVTLDPARDVTILDGIPVTTVARTLLDLSAVVPRRGVERALDRAEVLRVFDLVELRDQLRRNPRHPGTPLLHTVLGEHVAGDTVTDSELEEATFLALRDGDVPPAEHHGPIDCGDGGPIIRPDFVWRAQRVAAEVDGAESHLTRRAFEEDPIRDQRLKLAGWLPVRFTWRQVQREPEVVAATIRALLDARGG